MKRWILAIACTLTACSNEQLIQPKLPVDALQRIMEGIYAADQHLKTSKHPIDGVIVPHHLTAAESIASGIKMLTIQRPIKIILLSPDHFNRCPTILCTTNGIFSTALGNVNALTAEKLPSFITRTSDLFEQEHGIGAVLPFIAHYLPDAKVLPLVLSQKYSWKASPEEVLAYVQTLHDQGFLLIVSSDFSHYLSVNEADAMDEETAKVLFAGDLDGVATLKNPEQSDCPGCLWILASLAKEKNFYNPSTLLHTNSARLLDDLGIPETTSHFSMVWYRNDALDENDPTFGGDVTFTRSKRAFDLSPNLKLFWDGHGPRILNLEGPLSATCKPHPNPFIFCHPLSLWNQLKNIATYWGSENNHMFDQGRDGYRETLSHLEKVDSLPENIRVYSTTALINPVPDVPKNFIAEHYRNTIHDLQQFASDEILDVVFIHYGREYRALTNDDERKLLRSFIDAGADAVIGMHAHVISDMEIYKGKPIFYGIGNFLFDQYFSIPTSTTKMIRLRKNGENVMFETYVSIHD